MTRLEMWEIVGRIFAGLVGAAALVISFVWVSHGKFDQATYCAVLSVWCLVASRNEAARPGGGRRE